MIRRAAIPATLLLLTACPMRTGIDRNLTAVPPAKGIVLFSTGADDTSLTAAIGLNVVTSRSAALSATSPRLAGATDIVVNGSMSKSDFPYEHGNIRMLELDPGDYCFQPVSQNAALILKNAPYIAFRVKEGSVSYVGSVHKTAQRTFEVRDRQQRDLALFLEKNPSLKSQPIVSDLAVLSGSCAKR